MVGWYFLLIEIKRFLIVVNSNEFKISLYHVIVVWDFTIHAASQELPKMQVGGRRHSCQHCPRRTAEATEISLAPHAVPGAAAYTGRVKAERHEPQSSCRMPPELTLRPGVPGTVLPVLLPQRSQSLGDTHRSCGSLRPVSAEPPHLVASSMPLVDQGPRSIPSSGYFVGSPSCQPPGKQQLIFPMQLRSSVVRPAYVLPASFPALPFCHLSSS